MAVKPLALRKLEKQSKNIITLPINQFLKESEIKKICFEVNNFYEDIKIS